NPWLGRVVSVKQWAITNDHTGSELTIMSSDVASSYGLLLDFCIADEISLCPKRDLFDSLLSSAPKRASCLFLCIGNSGFRESWQWGLREQVRVDPDWYYSRLDGCCASWISPQQLDEQRRLLPTMAFERLWSNQWVSAAGDALSQEVIDHSFSDSTIAP